MVAQGEQRGDGAGGVRRDVVAAGACSSSGRAAWRQHAQRVAAGPTTALVQRFDWHLTQRHSAQA